MSKNYIGRAPAAPAEAVVVPSDAGRLLQSAAHVRTDYATGTTVMPVDDTIPQITEGNEFFSLVFTPQQIGSRCRVRVVASIGTNTTFYVAGAVFRDAVAPALVATTAPTDTANRQATLVMEHEFFSASLDPITFTGRFGISAAGSTYLNGGNAGRYFGGVYESFLKVDEYSV